MSSKTKLKYIASTLFLVATLQGCGGGGDGDTDTKLSDELIVSNISGIAQLGYITDANVKLIEISPEMTEVSSTITSGSEDDFGSFVFDEVNINNDSFYLIEVSGGQDIDSDDDGDVTNTPSVALNSSIHAVFRPSDSTGNIIRVNALTDIVYHRIKGDLEDIDLGSMLNQASVELIDSDIDGDGFVTYLDLLAFDPTKHADKTFIPYYQILNGYVRSLHEGSHVDSLRELFNIYGSEILIDGSSIYEVPFSLTAKIPHFDAATSVVWRLNGEVVTPENYLIDSPGIYQLSSEVLYENQRVALLTNDFSVVEPRVIATTNISPSNSSTLIIDDPVDTKLNGTVITVPVGAVSKSVELTASSLSIDVVPKLDDVVIGAVLSMGPPGTVFDKPVQIEIPYLSDVDQKNIRIARLSSEGILDYLVPIDIDIENKMVTFETEHFTKFVATRYLWGNTENHDQIISDLSDITGYSFANEEWEEVLNFEYVDNQTVFDLYLSWSAGKEVYNTIKNGSGNSAHIDAYNVIYGGDFTKVIADQIDVAFDLADGNVSLLISSVSGNLGGVVSSLLGLPSISLPNPTDSAKWATKEIIKSFVSAYNATALNEQIEKYFIARDSGMSASEVVNCLDTAGVCGGATATDNTKWFSGSYTPSESSTISLWGKIETLYIIYTSHKDSDYYDDSTSSDAFASVVSSVVASTSPNINIHDFRFSESSELVTSGHGTAMFKITLNNIPDGEHDLSEKMYVDYGLVEGSSPYCLKETLDMNKYTCSATVVFPDEAGSYSYGVYVVNRGVDYGASASKYLKVNILAQEASPSPMIDEGQYDVSRFISNTVYNTFCEKGEWITASFTFDNGSAFTASDGVNSASGDYLFMENNTVLRFSNLEGGSEYEYVKLLSYDSTDDVYSLCWTSDLSQCGANDFSELWVFDHSTAQGIVSAGEYNGQDCSNDANGIIQGQVIFGSEFEAVPSDAWVRLVPSINQVEDKYSGINCRLSGVDSVGNFGDQDCFFEDPSDVSSFSDPDETFQVIIYADENSSKTWEHDEISYCGFSEVEQGEWSEISCGTFLTAETNINNIHINTFNNREFASEGSLAVFAVTLDRPAQEDISFDYCTYDISAERDVDYTFECSTEVITSGNDTRLIKSSIIDDSVSEGAETFGMSIYNVISPIGVVHIISSEAQITINESD